jgi:hypothetical protein
MKFIFPFLILIILTNFIFSQDMVRVNVNSDPPGSTFVLSGGNDVMTTPTSMKFSKSVTYQITFSKPGYDSKTISYRGGNGDIFVKLEREHKQEQKPGPDMVRVNVNSDPSGATFVLSGGNDIMSTPTSMKFSKSVTYRITFSKSGYNSKTISYRGGTGDIFVHLEPQQQQHKPKPKVENKPIKKQNPKNNDNIPDMVRVNVYTNPQGAAFVLAGGHDIMFTPISMKFSRSVTYHITFTMPGYFPKTIVYRGGTGDINVNLQKATKIKH